MLRGNADEERIWNYLIDAGLSAYGAAGLMGNLYAESGLNPMNLQNSYEKKLGLSDAEYTAAVDNGTYTNFIRDNAGYGLAQWTYWSRKEALLYAAQTAEKSVGDLEVQLDYLMEELTVSFPAVLQTLKTAKTVREASDIVLLKFERPADQSEAAKDRRAGYGQTYYGKYACTSVKGGPMTEQELRNKVVDIAQSWLGCKEADGSHRQIIDVYNSHAPLARGYKMSYSDAWCAAYASAVFIRAELTDIAPTECSCSRMIALYKDLGCWQENDACVPQPGDLIMYDWDDTGKGDCKGNPEHVGIVVSVSGSKIKVIEGNKSDAVGYRTVQVNGRYIRGYCLPDYASKADKPAPSTGEAWYAEDLAWAVKAGITDGTRPEEVCTRAEVWAMLHRACG